VIQAIQTSAAPVAHPSLLAEAQSFLAGIFALDPAQAAIRGGLSVLVIFGAMLVIWGLHLVFKSIGERIAPEGVASNKERRKRIGRLTLFVTRLAVFAVCVVIILRLWGLDLTGFTQGPIGRLMITGARIALILALALAAVEIIDIAITGLFTRVAQRASTVRRASQLRTLAPVLVGVANTTLIVMASMMTLSQIGVEIGPLLAGAGIVGVAVGFGAQTVVKDFLTGVFLILEDAVSIGDSVKIGGFGGVVEEMSLRTIKLRDFDGTLHIFPYSEAQVIHNQTKSYSYYVIELIISRSGDIGKALDLMRSTGEEIRQDPTFKSLNVDEVEIAGVDKLSDAGIALKARIRTAPGKQWRVGREYLRRLKIALDEANVETPVPSLKLAMMDQPPPLDATKS
jgi:small conductance mechanosensitive channel